MAIQSSKNNCNYVELPEIILDTYNTNRILAKPHKAIGIFVSTCNPHNRMDCTHLFADVEVQGRAACHAVMVDSRELTGR